MKNFKQLVMLFLIATIGIVSCSKDDDGGEASIEGKWELFKNGTIISGNEELELYEHTEGCTKDYVEIKVGGTGSEHVFENNGTGCEDYDDTFTWTRNGNSLTLNYDGDVVTAEILGVTSTTLKIKFVDVDEVFITVLKRI